MRVAIIVEWVLLLSLSKMKLGLSLYSNFNLFQSSSFIKFAPTYQGKKHVSILQSSVEDSSIMFNNEGGNVVEKTKAMLRVGYKFSRPHTIKVS